VRPRRRKKRTGGGENHERWLITYADLITLLMIFFVVMYAMSKVDESKFDSLVVSLKNVFQPTATVPLEQVGGSAIVSRTPDLNRRDSAGAKERAQAERAQLDELKKKVEAFVQSKGLSGKINVLDTERGLQITLSDAALFDSGQAALKESAQTVLGGLAPFLQIVPNKVAVEGHTDNVPIRTERFPSNWELSSQRAVNVVHFFEGAGVAHERLQAVGLADTMPLAANDTDDGRAANRRVNLIVQRQYKMESINPLEGAGVE